MADTRGAALEGLLGAARELGHGPAAAAVQPCPLAKAWLAIQLVGEDDLPIAGEQYRVLLPDGTTKEGILDERGMASFEKIRPGVCKVSFPALDGEAWELL
jgi:hypothetical protein